MRNSLHKPLVALLAGLSAVAALAQPRPPSVHERHRPLLQQADSLVEAGQLGVADQLLQPAIRQARRYGDRRSWLALASLQATILSRAGHEQPAERAARDVLALALGLRDTTGVLHGLRLLGTKPVEHDALVEPAHEWLLRLALDRGDRRNEGYARMSRAEADLDAGLGLESRKGYERALDLLKSVGDWRGQAACLTRFGEACFALGDLDRGRRCLITAERIAARGGDRWAEGEALLALGSLEMMIGDGEIALESYRRALDALGGVQEGREWIATTLALAEAEQSSDQRIPAASLLTEALAASDSLGAPDLRGQALAQLVGVLVQEGRHDEVAALCRQNLVRRSRLEPRARGALLLALAKTLAARDSASQALALIERQAIPLGASVRLETRFETELLRAGLLRQLGRSREALRVLGRAARLEIEPAWRLERLLESASCHVDLGRPDSALAVLTRAVETWERSEMPRDPALRDRRAAAARAAALRLAGLWMRLAPADDPAGGQRAAFAVLQGFKARRLKEHTLGPVLTPADSFAGPLTLSLDDLQARLLRPQDLLLDVHVGPDTSILFAVTPGELRIVLLPSVDVLEASCEAFGKALNRDPQAAAALDPSAWKAALDPARQLVLEPVADLIGPSGRILFSGDGPLLRLPLASLSLPGSDSAPALGQTHEVVVIPSASFVTGTQRLAAAEASRILALGTVSGPRNATHGGLRSDRALGSRFQGGAVVLAGEPGTPPLDLVRLSGYDLLHLATELRLDDRRPWRTGFRIDAPDSSQSEAYLRASTIAGSRLSLDLAVLCRFDKGPPATTGEGVLCLSASFLAAGVPAVVTSLWPVDDATSTRFVKAFYAALEGGETLTQAVRSARSALRRHRPTRHPIHWAGFVVIGDGDVRAPLKRRFDLGLPLAFFAVASVGAVLLALRPRTPKQT